jgi:hypothetical protein
LDKTKSFIGELKMYKIKQYRPSFFSGYENEITEFETVDDFLKIDFVKHFTEIVRISESDYIKSKGFFVSNYDNMIFHVDFNSHTNQLGQWGVASIINGDVEKLKELFFNKWKLNSLGVNHHDHT